MKKLLHNKQFSLLFLAALIGVMGEGVFGLCSIVLVMNKTESIAEIGKMLVLTLVPSVFLAPFLGVFLDKYDKYRIAVVTHILRLISVGLIPASYFLGFFSLSIFYASVFFSYILWYIIEPAKESILKEILTEDEYSEGISLVQGAWQVGLLSSAILAGWIIDTSGVQWAIVVAASTYGIGALLFFLLSRDSKEQTGAETTQGDFWAEFRAGWTFLLQNKPVFFLVLTTSMVLPYFYAINVLLVPFNYHVLDGSGVTLGLIDSGAGIGSLISALFCGFIAKKRNLSLFLSGSIMLLAASTIFFSLSQKVAVAVLFYFLIGFFAGNMKVMSRIYLFKLVETSYIGRVMTSVSLLSLTFAIISSLGVSLLAEKSMLQAYVLAGAGLMLPFVCAAIGLKAMTAKRTMSLSTEN